MPTLNAQGMKSMRTSLMQFTHTKNTCTHTNAAHKYAHMHSTYLYALINTHTYTDLSSTDKATNVINNCWKLIFVFK